MPDDDGAGPKLPPPAAASQRDEGPVPEADPLGPSVKQKSSDNTDGNPRELPQPFVCHVCGVCVAEASFLLKEDPKADSFVFSELSSVQTTVIQGRKTLVCPHCEHPLGCEEADKTFLVRKDKVKRRQKELDVLVAGLKEQELADTASLVRSLFPNSTVTQRVLKKAELRGFEFTEVKKRVDFVVVVHRNEGRVLLTDRNGFYNDVLGSAWRQTCGNVIVLLTKKATPAADAIFDQSFLQALSTQGDQPTMGALGLLGRVLMWDSSPSEFQLRQLRQLLIKAYGREKPVKSDEAAGIPSNWLTPPRQKSSSVWCNVL